MKELNEEQRNAVEARDGVLLGAGAGSGKTTVLVNRVIFLLDSFLEENKNVVDLAFVKILGRYLSEIALITFTKKATGEIGLRLGELIEEKASVFGGRWIVVQREMEKMHIGTIHSFYLKLLQRGHFPEVGTGFSVTDSCFIEKKIKTIFRRWLEEEMPKRIECGRERVVIEAIMDNRFQIEKTLLKIFDDPELRRSWETRKPTDRNDAKVLGDILDVLQVRDVAERPFQIEEDILRKKAKWVQYYRDFEALKISTPLTVETVADYAEVLKEWSSSPSKAKLSDRTEKYFVNLKVLKGFISSNRDDFEHSSHPNVALWEEMFRDIVLYVSRRYDLLPGFSYADIEYYTLKGLENPVNQKRVAENLRQIIVDEFQDTSMVQFHILEKIIDGNFDRLYCVGDEKQAIYGFRGGEPGVFEDMKGRVKNHLQLKINYRSNSDIVDFNNKLFADIFVRKDEGFFQCGDKKADGQRSGLNRYDVQVQNIDAAKNLSPAEAEEIEAARIFRIIKDAIGRGEGGNICILYSKLSPSIRLVDKFVRDKAALSAQVKIQQKDDPLIAIFGVLLEGMLKRNPGSRGYCVFMIGNILKYLQSTTPQEKVGLAIDKFYNHASLFGIIHSFRKFVSDIGLHNSNNEHNLKTIENIVRANFENVDDIYSEITRLSGNYSIDFHLGGGASKISIMTVHASKGLEFDHVILAGIHVYRRNSEPNILFGTLPGSFKWREGLGKKPFFKMPTFILEDLVDKEKDSAELKRLLYVACTRAKGRLDWVDISYDGKPYSYGRQAWIHFMRLGTQYLPGGARYPRGRRWMPLGNWGGAARPCSTAMVWESPWGTGPTERRSLCPCYPLPGRRLSCSAPANFI